MSDLDPTNYTLSVFVKNPTELSTEEAANILYPQCDDCLLLWGAYEGDETCSTGCLDFDRKAISKKEVVSSIQRDVEQVGMEVTLVVWWHQDQPSYIDSDWDPRGQENILAKYLKEATAGRLMAKWLKNHVT